MALGSWVSRKEKKKLTSLSHQPNREDLVYVAGLMEAGKVEPVIDRCFPLEETTEAFRHYAAGHMQGKVMINMDLDILFEPAQSPDNSPDFKDPPGLRTKSGKHHNVTRVHRSNLL